MSYLVEQLPHCDLLRLSLLTGDLSCQLDKSSKSYCQISSTFHHNLKVVILLSETLHLSPCRTIGTDLYAFFTPKTLHLSPRRLGLFYHFFPPLFAVRKRYIFHPNDWDWLPPFFLHFLSRFESCYFAVRKRYIFHPSVGLSDSSTFHHGCRIVGGGFSLHLSPHMSDFI